MSNTDFTGGLGGTFAGGGASGDWTSAPDTKKVAEVTKKVVSSGTATNFTAASTSPVIATQLDSTPAPMQVVNINAPRLPKGTTADFRVKIISKINPEDKVEFAVMPQIGEQRQVNYTATDLVHHAGQMQIYRTTGARVWDITGILVSRTSDEAAYNLGVINLLRSWLMPYYGSGTAKSEAATGSRGKLGAPPDTLTFTAYGPQMIGPVPVVLTAASWTWPNDVTYIETSVKNFRSAFPVTLSVHCTLTESYSASEYSSFSLADYKNGDVGTAFGGK